MKPASRNILLGACAAVLAGLCTVAMPLLNHALNPRAAKKESLRTIAVGLKSMEPSRPEMKPKRALRQPMRARPAPTVLKAGPRFAMDLGVAGGGGAAASPPLPPGGGRGSGRAAGGDEGVDERPSPSFPPPFRMPQEVKAREKDASLMLSFCVDVSGRPYEIRVVEEKPAGLGMAEAGREALRQTRFTPAKKAGLAVPFCGLEQPFEVKFSN